MPHKCKKKREMIIVDEREPVGELPPPFPPRNVVVKDDDDVRKFYDLKQEIGRGRFGTVYMVSDKETGQKFAAKFVNTKRNQDRANVEREIEIMKALNAERPHPRLIQLYDAFDMDKQMCLVLEIVDGGELFERVIDDDFVLTEKACTIFVRQICEGVEFIHSKNILHLDMKPENILCLSREGNRIKICDFGLARKYDPRKKLQVLFGTPEFVAPEVVNFEPISFGTDMWSVGVITYVLLSGLSPFMGHNYVETMTNVTKNKYDFEDEAFNSVSEDAKDFIRKLLVLDKSLRLTPAQCQRHTWLRQPPTSTLRRSMKLARSDSEEEEESDEDETDVEDFSIEEKIIREEQENEKDKKRQEEEIENQREAEAKKKEEELELTKKQLKDFVERWNSHPNSPYLIGTPVSWDLQRVVKTGGWDSRASFASVAVGPPSDQGDISDPEDDVDIIDQEEFIHYTIEPKKQLAKQLSPEEVAKELGDRLILLQEEEMVHNKESREKTQELEKADVELHNVDNKDKFIEKDAKITINNNKASDVQMKSAESLMAEIEITENNENELLKKPPESKRKTIETQKETKEEKLEKHRKAYEERKKKLKSVEEEKKKDAANADNKDLLLNSDLNEVLESNEGHLQNELKKENTHTMDRTRPPEECKTHRIADENKVQKSKSRDLIKCEEDTASETLRKINEKPMSDYKKEYEEYLKMVNEVQKKPDEPVNKENQKKASSSLKLSTSGKTNEIKAEEKPSNHKRPMESPKKTEKEANKKNDNEKKTSSGQKKPFFQRFRFGKENKVTDAKSQKEKEKEKQTAQENELDSFKVPETNIEDHKKLYQEYLQMMDTQKQVDTQSDINENKTEVRENKPLDHRLQNGKETKLVESSRELQRKVSDAYKASEAQRKSSARTIENLPKEPLKRPEIIAIQNEELGGSVPRQRKKSVPSRFEMGGECLVIDRGSRGSTPGSPGRDDASDYNSRGPTPTKQLKKQPSRDVPLQAKDASVTYITLDSGDLTPDASPGLSRKASCEERSPSRVTREGTPVNRRPSRDVPLTPAQLERLSGASAIGAFDICAEPQAWPDLIVVPQGDDSEECSDYKDSLDVPVATLVKSPSGTLLSIPGLTVSQHDKENPATSETKNESDTAYVPSNKLVAWILDIGNAQQQRSTPFTTSDRVSQWEARDGSPRPTVRSRDPSPRPRSRSPCPSERQRDKSPIPNKHLPALYPLSREPSSISLKSSDSSENLIINTPWGTMKRSPRTNLSKSPSFEVSSITLRELQNGSQRNTEDLSQYTQSDDHMSVDSSTRSPSPKMLNNRLQKQDTLEITDVREFEHCSRLSGELPPKAPEKTKALHRSKKEDNLNNHDFSRQGETKSHTLPRQARLTKQNSVDERKLDNKKHAAIDLKKTTETSNNDNLKRKSKFPPSPNQKKKFGPLLLFSAQDRISQFEQTPKSDRPSQRPITRTKSNMVFSKSSEKFHPTSSLMENSILCDENKNTKSQLLSSKSVDKTNVKYLTNRLLDKVGKSTGILASEVIQNVDSVNNNVGNARRNSSIIGRRDSTGATKR